MSSSSQERDHSIREHQIALLNVSVGGCKIRWSDAACARDEDRVTFACERPAQSVKNALALEESASVPD